MSLSLQMTQAAGLPWMSELRAPAILQATSTCIVLCSHAVVGGKAMCWAVSCELCCHDQVDPFKVQMSVTWTYNFGADEVRPLAVPLGGLGLPLIIPNRKQGHGS
jgi:hypothetical protein